tara:strand:- start:10425 stop:11807 length:1383 start_codon:yes stop_codon:yes gene_type:complete
LKSNEIKKFYKSTEKLIKERNYSQLIGMPYLSPHFPRSFIKSNYSLKLKRKFAVYKYLRRVFFSKKEIIGVRKKKFNNVILSHLVSYENLDFKNDFYFKDIPSFIGNERVLIILIDHINFDRKKLKKKKLDNYMILSKNVGFFYELWFHLSTLVQVIYSGLFHTKLKIISFRNILSSIDNQRIAHQVKSILKFNNTKNFFFTFEGNPYEKLVCNEIKKINSKTKLIGYQFSVIRKFQNSIFQKIGDNYTPDHILTIGDYNKRKLQKNFKKKVDVSQIGLFKKENYFIKNNFNIYKKNKFKVLVMPEGIPDELSIFLKFCKNNYNENILFNLRLHPILYQDKFSDIKFKNIKNLKISKDDIFNDFKKNDIILYRGTAGVIDAINNGLIPIYLSIKNEITVDPIYEINKKNIINFDDKLIYYLEKRIKNKENKFNLKKIQRFAKFYYHKPNYNPIKKILNER